MACGQQDLLSSHGAESLTGKPSARRSCLASAADLSLQPAWFGMSSSSQHPMNQGYSNKSIPTNSL